MLYKYRTLKNFKNFVDIILKQRLYAANYKDLNDPMEGRYLYSNTPASRRIVKAIRGQKQPIRIVSLSRNDNHMLMWAHYADGHRGVVIGVEVDTSLYRVRKVKYNRNFLRLETFNDLQPYIIAEKVLLNKINVWEYEEEERILVKDGSKFIYVKVREVIAGSSMSNQDYGFLRDLIKMIDSSIKVRRANEYIDKIHW